MQRNTVRRRAIRHRNRKTALHPRHRRHPPDPPRRPARPNRVSLKTCVVSNYHRAPKDTPAAVEIPRAVKKHLGLDDERSWVVVSEGDQFVWPGYDLRKVRSTDRYDYGYLPPRFFKDVLAAFRVWHKSHKVKVTPR